MNFARKHMQSMGWTEGQGLGADESGLTQALKPQLKFDNHGLGFDVTAHTGVDQWWNQSFNCSANFVDFRLCHTSGGLKVKPNSGRSGRKRRSNKPEFTTDEVVANDNDQSVDTTVSDGDEEVVEDAKKSSAATVDNKYGNYFVKTVEDNATTGDDDVNELPTTDPRLTKTIDFDELYRKSGGLTGHKASRVGIKMNAKLMRIEAQNEEFLRKHKKLKH